MNLLQRKDPTATSIDNLKEAIAQSESSLEAKNQAAQLAQQQAQQAQLALEQRRQELQRLEAQRATEEREAELDKALQDFRSDADEFNVAAEKYQQALEKLYWRVGELPQKAREKVSIRLQNGTPESWKGDSNQLAHIKMREFFVFHKLGFDKFYLSNIKSSTSCAVFGEQARDRLQ